MGISIQLIGQSEEASLEIDETRPTNQIITQNKSGWRQKCWRLGNGGRLGQTLSLNLIRINQVRIQVSDLKSVQIILQSIRVFNKTNRVVLLFIQYIYFNFNYEMIIIDLCFSKVRVFV